MKVNFNHIEPISTVDYPGKTACVVFFNGCPWRCPYCHNKQTWTEVNMVDIEYVKEQIKACLPFVSAVVFSGGEPTMQSTPLIKLCEFSKSLGLYVGIETNGHYPWNLAKLNEMHLIDRIFLDIKAPINSIGEYYKSTGCLSSMMRVNTALNKNLPIEIRIVDIDKYHTQDIIKSIGDKHKITILPYIKRD